MSIFSNTFVYLSIFSLYNLVSVTVQFCLTKIVTNKSHMCFKFKKIGGFFEQPSLKMLEFYHWLYSSPHKSTWIKVSNEAQSSMEWPTLLAKSCREIEIFLRGSCTLKKLYELLVASYDISQKFRKLPLVIR